MSLEKKYPEPYSLRRTSVAGRVRGELDKLVRDIECVSLMLAHSQGCRNKRQLWNQSRLTHDCGVSQGFLLDRLRALQLVKKESEALGVIWSLRSRVPDLVGDLVRANYQEGGGRDEVTRNKF